MVPFSGPLVRSLAAAMLLGSVALAGLLRAPCFAQASDPATVSGDAASALEKEAPPVSLDPIEARIRYLHDRLRISPAQEPLWAKVAQAMRDNAASVAPLIRERLQSAAKSDAVDNLGSYEKLGEAQLDGLKRFIAAFKALYAGLSEQQKKIADTLFRTAPLSMVGRIPQLAEALIAPEPLPYGPSYAAPLPEPVAPLYPRYAYAAPYGYYPPYTYFPLYYPLYGPWLLRSPIVVGVPFLGFHRFHHHHPFMAAGPFGHRGVFHGQPGILRHRR